jgi:hypothetical protein
MVCGKPGSRNLIEQRQKCLIIMTIYNRYIRAVTECLGSCESTETPAKNYDSGLAALHHSYPLPIPIIKFQVS